MGNNLPTSPVTNGALLATCLGDKVLKVLHPPVSNWFRVFMSQRAGQGAGRGVSRVRAGSYGSAYGLGRNPKRDTTVESRP